MSSISTTWDQLLRYIINYFNIESYREPDYRNHTGLPMPQRPGLVTQCECLAFVHDNWIVCSENLALLQRENRGKSRLQTHLGLQAGYPRGGPTYLPAKKDA